MSKLIRYCPTVAIIKLAALEHNLYLIKSYTNGQKICAIVKANAYGHGVEKIAPVLQNMQIDCFGVSFVDEAIYLRNIGITKPIIILGGVYNNTLDNILKYNLTPVLGAVEQLETFVKKAVECKTCFNVHLEIDTGMARLGVLHNNISLFVKKAMEYSNYIKIVGVMTHLSSAHLPSDLANSIQIERFINAIAHISEHKNLTLHLSNSSAILSMKDEYAFCSMVRCGSLLYGIQPLEGIRISGLKPVMELHTKIVAIRHVLPGSPISYNGTYITPNGYISCIATIPVGFADGYRRNLSNCAMVLVHGTRVPVVGCICMDMCMIDVSTIKNPIIGDDVVLVGVQGNSEIYIDDLANWANTSNLDIVCAMSNRIPRKYVYE